MSWDDLVEAVPARESNAAAEIAQLATPSIEVVPVRLPRRVITSKEQLEEFLSDARSVLEATLESGKHPSV